jgi:nucleoside-diphosphate-sugar epimerase
MRLLVLGGSWFVGRVVVDDAVRRGHQVTVFNRGRSPAPVPAGVRRVLGDREDAQDLRRLAGHGPWDALVDVSGSVPAVVRRSAEILTDVAGHCAFVSTISAYRDWPHAPVDEFSPLWDGDPDLDPGTRRWDPDAYGPLKVGCEIACREAFGDGRLLVLRPHVVLGRYEYVGRLPWWLARMRRGGQVLAPAPDRGIQPADVRDLAAFLLDQVERAVTGGFNVAPRPDAATYGDMLHACVEATDEPARRPVELVWADEDWLVEQGVTQWTELPLWRNAAAPWGMNVDRALAAGLRCRPLSETVADTWAWLNAGGRGVDHERSAEHGMAPAREAALIGRWLAQPARPTSASSRTPG